jgi:hypothetical protein
VGHRRGLLLLSFCGLSSFLSHFANMSSLAPSLLDLMSGRPSEKAMPKVTDPAFFGHQFKWDGHMYTICRKTASKRGGTSWIWRYGTELRQVSNLSKKAWLCCTWTNNSTLKLVISGSTTPRRKGVPPPGLLTCSIGSETTVSICLRYSRWHTTCWPSRQ